MEDAESMILWKPRAQRISRVQWLSRLITAERLGKKMIRKQMMDLTSMPQSPWQGLVHEMIGVEFKGQWAKEGL